MSYVLIFEILQHLKKQKCQISSHFVTPDNISLSLSYFCFAGAAPVCQCQLFKAQCLDGKGLSHDLQTSCWKLLLLQGIQLSSIVIAQSFGVVSLSIV